VYEIFIKKIKNGDSDRLIKSSALASKAWSPHTKGLQSSGLRIAVLWLQDWLRWRTIGYHHKPIILYIFSSISPLR